MVARGVRVLAALLALALLVGGTALPVLARLTPEAPHESVEPAPPSLAEQLTTDLVRAHVRYHLAATRQKPRLEQDLLTTARTREQLLVQLAETDPAQVLRLALPSNIRRSFPARVRAHLEEHVDVEGALEIVDGAGAGRTHYRLDTVVGALALRFAGQDEPEHINLLAGTRVRVKGVRVGHTLAAGGSTGSVQPVTAGPA
jgi:hypothetical protein